MLTFERPTFIIKDSQGQHFTIFQNQKGNHTHDKRTDRNQCKIRLDGARNHRNNWKKTDRHGWRRKSEINS